ncbi:hypothetical protein [Streptomyces odonnellii]|uniref:hypothetical protein n=1 Tax=Streptomyces odonnellii TaxID=1417980 RepID=UPI000626770F|nr:hypothetical protein [Streptomyces odonnellii]
MSGRKDRHGFGHEHEPSGPDAPLNDLTGNGIVNNGPDDELSGLGHTGAGSSAESGDGRGSDREDAGGTSVAGGKSGADGTSGADGAEAGGGTADGRATAGTGTGRTGSHEPRGDADEDAGDLKGERSGEPGAGLSDGPSGDRSGGPSGGLSGDRSGGPSGDLTAGLSGLSGLGGLGGLNRLGGLDSVQGPDGLAGSVGSEGSEADELALRRLLHSAVDDLRPSEGALDHLRKAVPARRARKRQAVVGMAAAALLFGTAVPAFVHVANSAGTADEHSVNAGHGEQAQGGTNASKDSGGGWKDSDQPSDKVSPAKETPSKVDKPENPASGGTTEGGSGDKANPGDAHSSSSPACSADQLGVTTAEAGAPDAGGTVYGTFRVANVSGTECSVTGSGSVRFQTGGAADQSKINVVAHTAGDAASGLPDPSQEATTVLLAPNSAYEVKFAWVPAETCPTTGASPDPSPSGGDTSAGSGTTGGTDGGTGTDAGTGTGTNTESQLLSEGGTMDGSVSVLHTPEPGAPVAQTTIPNACAGTIYRTGVLDAQ